MSISRIINHFEALGRGPVEIDDVLAEFQKYIIGERVEIHAIKKAPDSLRGFHFRYNVPPIAGSALGPERVAVAAYYEQQNIGWQRLVCCKELVHIFDSDPIKTRSRVEVVRLGQHLAGQASIGKINGSNIQFFFDELAKFQALAILFPFSLRQEIINIHGESVDISKVANAVLLPEEFVAMVISDKWQELRENILSHC